MYWYQVMSQVYGLVPLLVLILLVPIVLHNSARVPIKNASKSPVASFVCTVQATVHLLLQLARTYSTLTNCRCNFMSNMCARKLSTSTSTSTSTVPIHVKVLVPNKPITGREAFPSSGCWYKYMLGVLSEGYQSGYEYRLRVLL